MGRLSIVKGGEGFGKTALLAAHMAQARTYHVYHTYDIYHMAQARIYHIYVMCHMAQARSAKSPYSIVASHFAVDGMPLAHALRELTFILEAPARVRGQA